MVAAALIGVSGDDHIGHHLIYFDFFLFYLIFKYGPEKGQKDCIFESLFLIPVAVSLVSMRLPEMAGFDDEGQFNGYLEVLKVIFRLFLR
jgi:hypothetical protein